MSNDKTDARHPFRPEEMDLNQLTIEELSELKDSIMARARESIGPAGFNPIMMDTGDGGNPMDWYTDPPDWFTDFMDSLVQVVNLASRRLSLAIMTVGMGVIGVTAGGTERGNAYGTIALGATAALGVWFIVEMTRTVKSVFRR
jgi:hypothetical protein